MFFPFFDRRPVSRDKDCYIVCLKSVNFKDAKVLAGAKVLTIFKHGGLVQQAGTVRERVRP